jgi:hypothetical protein
LRKTINCVSLVSISSDVPKDIRDGDGKIKGKSAIFEKSEKKT